MGSAYDLTVPPPDNWLGFVTNFPTLQDVWDLDSGGQAVGVATVYIQPTDADGDGVISKFELEFSPVPPQRIEFDANGIMDWMNLTERGANAGYKNNAAMEIRYNTMLASAVAFDLSGVFLDRGWRWLGPLDYALGGSTYSAALLVNDAGTIAGYGAIQSGTHAFRVSGHQEFACVAPILQDLGALSGGIYSFPRAMSRTGQLVGYSQYQSPGSPADFHGVFWDTTDIVPQDLRSLQQHGPDDLPAGASDAYAINNNRQIVGNSRRAVGGSAAVLWQFNQNHNQPAGFWEITDLNQRLTDDQWNVFNAVGINDDGLILAHAQDTANEKHAVLLATPQLAVDANRDETITFDDADKTTDDKPYRFWLNDDMDVSSTDWKWSEPDPEIYPPTRPDSANTIINSPRDCEDLARLWLDTGNLVNYVQDPANDLYLGLKWENVSGNPAIHLFRSADTSGGLV